MTRLFAYLEEAFASLWRNRVRSALTMLGMIIGSASIIAVFGISKAATSGISSTFNSFGSAQLVLIADRSQDYPERAAMHYRDLGALRFALGDRAQYVVPSWNRTLPVTFGNDKQYYPVVSDGGVHVDSLQMLEGRKISEDDVQSGARVCVITQDIAEQFFHGGSAVGNYLRINGGMYEVVGVYADIKGSFLSSITSATSVAIPYTTYYNNITQGAVDLMLIYPTDSADSAGVQKTAIAAMQRIHGSRSKYTTQNLADILGSFETVLNIIGIGLSAIGGVALVVAGIGIMNIMLVSVTERTREIGIRKSIGASRNDIALQFLMESVLLSLMGGGVGTGIGLLATIGAASLLSKQLGELLIPYLLIISIALIFSFLVGTVFGTYPALRAAQMDPIEALRS